MGPALVESQHPKNKNEDKKALPPAPLTTNQVKNTEAVFGGYFMDLVKANRKRPFFDLKVPIDPVKDFENLSFYPGTDHVQAIVLFSIKH